MFVWRGRGRGEYCGGENTVGRYVCGGGGGMDVGEGILWGDMCVEGENTVGRYVCVWGGGRDVEKGREGCREGEGGM
jgi:hypothetical protein